MPKEILLSIFWDEECTSMSYYEMDEIEIEEMAENYEYTGQLLMFSYFPIDIFKEWLWDVFAKQPHHIVIDQIIF